MPANMPQQPVPVPANSLQKPDPAQVSKQPTMAPGFDLDQFIQSNAFKKAPEEFKSAPEELKSSKVVSQAACNFEDFENLEDYSQQAAGEDSRVEFERFVG